MNNELDNSLDNRYFPRWKVQRRLVFRKGFRESSLEARSVDLSCSGLSFKTDEDVQLGEEIVIKLHFSSEEFTELNGRVVWIKQNSAEKDVGVQFYNTTEEAQEMILDHAFEIKKK